MYTQEQNFSQNNNNTIIIQKNIPLADKNWFGTGGSALFYCEPQTAVQFKDALLYANQHNLEIFILGQGANILISDDGFDGIVIKPQLKSLEILLSR